MTPENKCYKECYYRRRHDKFSEDVCVYGRIPIPSPFAGKICLYYQDEQGKPPTFLKLHVPSSSETPPHTKNLIETINAI